MDAREESAPSTGEEVGEATGGISGVLVGAGIGSAAGPIGTLIGGIAGAIGGWWAGRAVADSAAKLTREDDEYFREHYMAQAVVPADLGYDAVRGAYYLGHIAGNNPNVGDGDWASVEADLGRGWMAHADRYGSWNTVSSYAAEGFSRSRWRLYESARRARIEHDLGEEAERRE
jgi:hypothetical protein